MFHKLFSIFDKTKRPSPPDHLQAGTQTSFDKSFDTSSDNNSWPAADVIDADEIARVIKDEKIRFKNSLRRVRLMAMVFTIIFTIPLIRLAYLGFVEKQTYETLRKISLSKKAPKRPDIVDRNGVLLAIDLPTRSLWANPKKILDLNEAVDGLQRIFKDKSRRYFYNRLKSKARFVWLKRNISPLQEEALLRMGIPGLHFLSETHRAYPVGQLAPHILGYVDIENKGQAGIEKYIDTLQLDRAILAKLDKGYQPDQPKDHIQLSIDIRIQHAMRRELAHSLARYRAKGAAGILMNINSGEVLSLVSLPDFDPVIPKLALKPENIDRMNRAVFELGSVMKIFNTAMAFEELNSRLGDTFDVRKPIRIGRFQIRDFHGPKGYLTIPEIFINSSNIGSARIAQKAGIKTQKDFFHKVGLFTPLSTESGGIARPLIQENWQQVHSLTASFGHGISFAPLQFASASAALFNGGVNILPKFTKRNENSLNKIQVIDEQTSEKMKVLMRLNVLEGTGRAANVKGYLVGGKTGTADKPGKNGYGPEVVTSFVSIFPANKPQYLMYILFDEPQGPAGKRKPRTSSVNAVPATARLISVIAPILGLRKNLSRDTWFRREDYLRPASRVGEPALNMEHLINRTGTQGSSRANNRYFGLQPR